MLGAFVVFELKDEVKKQLGDMNVAKKHIGKVVEACRTTPGMKEKYFIMDPKTLAQGAFLVFDNQKNWDAYLKSKDYKETVLDICKGKPRVETYVYTASLRDGVVL
jgi:hypothetical protein